MAEDFKEKISALIVPILITVIGYFIIATINDLQEDIEALQKYNVDRDLWVRDWIEKYQPTLDYAEQLKNGN